MNQLRKGGLLFFSLLTERRSHNIYQINTKPDTPQFSGHAQYFTQSNNLKKSSHLSPTYKETVT